MCVRSFPPQPRARASPSLPSKPQLASFALRITQHPAFLQLYPYTTRQGARRGWSGRAASAEAQTQRAMRPPARHLANPGARCAAQPLVRAPPSIHLLSSHRFTVPHSARPPPARSAVQRGAPRPPGRGFRAGGPCSRLLALVSSVAPCKAAGGAQAGCGAAVMSSARGDTALPTACGRCRDSAIQWQRASPGGALPRSRARPSPTCDARFLPQDGRSGDRQGHAMEYLG